MTKHNKQERQGVKPWLKHYDTHVPPNLSYADISINQLLEEAVRKYPAQTFLRWRGSAMRYDEAGACIERLSRNLTRLGLQKGQRVALLLPNIPQFVLAYYAVLKAGGVVAALNPHYRAAELGLLLQDCQPVMAIGLESQLDTLMELRRAAPLQKLLTTRMQDWEGGARAGASLGVQEEQPTIALESLLFGELEGDALPLPQVGAEDAAIFQYSGGTTGRPKAAIGLQRNLIANVTQFRTWCNLQEWQEVILAAIPLYHVYGMVLAMNMGAALGAEVVLIDDARDVGGILRQIEQHRVSFYPGVPSMYYAINQHPEVRAGRWRLDSIKACISGSAPLHPQIKEEFERLTGGKLVEGYGLSEAPTATHCNPLYGRNKSGSIGLPLPDVDCRVVDLETGERELAAGETGELTLRGPQVMQGYHNAEQENRQALRGGWLHTGDVVRMDAEGYFAIVDRKKDLIKVGGLQVWPNEVEAAIKRLAGVADCAVAGVPDLAQGEKVVAWVVRKDARLEAEAVREGCRNELAAYKLPSQVIFIEQLPRTGVGKVLRRELVRGYLTEVDKS